MARARENDAFGDFQTPVELAADVWRAVDLHGVDVVVEPTAGVGAFLRTAPEAARRLPWVAFDLNPAYVETSREVADAAGIRARIAVADAFGLDDASFPEVAGRSVLAIGNPPWVTNAAQARLTTANLPEKWNRFGLRGLDAMTGKANFDVAEAILLTLMAALGEAAEMRLAFLLKRSVALKLARDLLGSPGCVDASFVSIDARRWFGASVEAGLLQLVVRPATAETTLRISIGARLGEPASSVAGLVDGRYVEDVGSYERHARVEAERGSGLVWRQGIKHDMAKLLELRRTAEGPVNGDGELVQVESSVLCPLYKSSDVAGGRAASRVFPLFQHDLSGPMSDLATRWPELAAYLDRHRARFRERRSSIYRNKPDFMLFGVGEYSLAPYKVAISGFYKEARFAVLGPDEQGRPPLVDDTCYLLPFHVRDDAERMADYLNGPAVQGFLRAIVDSTAKRPYTKSVLDRIAPPRGALAASAA